MTVRATIEKKSAGHGDPFEHDKKGGPHFFKVKEEGGGWLGVHLQNLTDQLGDYFGVSDGDGALVSEVIDDSPAERAGLEAGDVIISYDDKEIDDVEELIEAVRQSDPGDEVEIVLIRNKSKRTLRAQVGEIPKTYRWPELDVFGLPHHGRDSDIRLFYDDEDPLDGIWRYRHRGDVGEDDIRDLEKRLERLEREIEKMKDRL